jgi:peptide chain release factor subunit 1
MCDSRFHVEPLLELMQDDDIFGFIIMDGNGALYGTVQGNVRKVLYKFSVELPKKHGRGGQSSARFARIRQEKRHNYVRKVAETAVQMFITADALNVKGLVLAGSADFKSVLEKSDLFDPRLLAAVLKKVDVSYGGEPGFNQAIELAADALANVKLVAEKKLISKLFEEIAMDSGKYCFGVKDTTTALEMSVVERLILWEELELNRYQLKHPVTGNPKVLYLKPGEERDASKFRDEEAGVDYEIVSKDPFVDWIAEHYKEFGTELHFVTDRSSEGAQFVKGFGGIGGVLRFKVDFVSLAVAEEEEEEFI